MRRSKNKAEKRKARIVAGQYLVEEFGCRISPKKSSKIHALYVNFIGVNVETNLSDWLLQMWREGKTPAFPSPRMEPKPMFRKSPEEKLLISQQQKESRRGKSSKLAMENGRKRRLQNANTKIQRYLKKEGQLMGCTLPLPRKEAISKYLSYLKISFPKNKDEWLLEEHKKAKLPGLDKPLARKQHALSNKVKRESYKTYIRSEAWRKKRQEVFALKGEWCDDCGTSSNLHVHHLTYDNLFNEKMEDLQVLCKSCHEKEHGRSFSDYSKKKRKKRKKKAA